MKKLMFAVLLSLTSTSVMPCTLVIELDQFQRDWAEGIRIYQDGGVVSTLSPDIEEIPCADAGLKPGLGPINAQIFRGADESEHSPNATFVFDAPQWIRAEFRVP